MSRQIRQILVGGLALAGPVFAGASQTGIKPKLPNGWPVATTQNGYSDYLKIAEAMMSKATQALDYPPKGGDPKEIQRKRYALIRPWLATLEAGNAKAVFDPRTQVSLATLYPELFYMKRLAKWVADTVDVEFGAGHPDVAFRWLKAGTIFAAKAPEGTNIQILVGQAISNIAMKSAYRHRRSLSESQLRALIDGFGGFIRHPMVLFRAEKRDGMMLVGLFEEMRRDPKVLGLKDDESLAQITDFLRGADADRYELEHEYRAMYEWRASLYRQPEATWAAPPTAPDPGFPISGYLDYWKDHTSHFVGKMKLMDIVEKLSVGDGIEAHGTETIRRRTHVRLMRVQLLAERFQRQHHRYPTSLSELNAPQLTTDPLTGKPFRYWLDRKTNSVEVEVESAGVKATGPIRLFQMPKSKP